MSWLRIFTAVLSALVVFAVIGVAAQAALGGGAYTCRDPAMGRAECQRNLRSSTQDLLDALKSFDDTFRRKQIDDALDTLRAARSDRASPFCVECERMLREARP